MMLLVSTVRLKSDDVTRSKPFVSKSVERVGCKRVMRGLQFLRPRMQRLPSECYPRLPAVLQIQPIPSGLPSNRLDSSFRGRYSAQSRALSTTPPEFSPERCRHPTTSPPAHQSIVFVNNLEPSHFPFQFLLQCALSWHKPMTPWLPSPQLS